MICVSFFLIYDLIVGKAYDIGTILLSFIGWESIGNSTWFMFVTFVLYLLIYFVFSIHQKKSKTDRNKLVIPLVVFTLAVCAFAIVLHFVKNEGWYNTIFCFPLGMWYSYYKDKIDCILHKAYWLLVLGAFLTFCGTYLIYLRYHVVIAFCLCSCFFALLVVFVTTRVRFRSYFFAFLGKHVFSIYILQRLCFLILQGCIDNNYVYFCVSFIMTVATAFVYDWCFSVVKQRFVCKKNK